jgi:hypothetical protein
VYVAPGRVSTRQQITARQNFSRLRFSTFT